MTSLVGGLPLHLSRADEHTGTGCSAGTNEVWSAVIFIAAVESSLIHLRLQSVHMYWLTLQVVREEVKVRSTVLRIALPNHYR